MSIDKDIVILIIVSLNLILLIVPRPWVRWARRLLSRFVYWQWRRMSLLSAKLYAWLYERINGNNDDERK